MVVQDAKKLHNTKWFHFLYAANNNFLPRGIQLLKCRGLTGQQSAGCIYQPATQTHTHTPSCLQQYLMISTITHSTQPPTISRMGN